MNEPSPFASVLVRLQQNDVPFLVCGGLAVAFCGFVRATDDVDILVSVEKQNVRKLLKALAALGEGLGGTLAESDFTAEPGCFEINEKDCTIDIFTLMDGKTYEELLPHSAVIQLENLRNPVRHLSRKQLIEAKSSSSREKDRIDVDALRRLERDQPE